MNIGQRANINYSDPFDFAFDLVQSFVDWYNDEHKHSKINFVTPSERHAGKDSRILAQRKCVVEAAKKVNPLRWSGETRNCTPAGVVMLNPDRPENVELSVAG